MESVWYGSQGVSFVWHPNFFPHFRLGVACFLINDFQLELSRPVVGDGILQQGRYIHATICRDLHMWSTRFPEELAQQVSSHFDGAPPQLRRAAFISNWLDVTHNKTLKFVEQIPDSAIWRNDYLIRWRELSYTTFQLLPKCHELAGDVARLYEIIKSAPIFDLASKTLAMISHDCRSLNVTRDGQSYVRDSFNANDADAILFDPKNDRRFDIFYDTSIPVFEREPLPSQDPPPASSREKLDLRINPAWNKSQRTAIASVFEWLEVPGKYGGPVQTQPGALRWLIANGPSQHADWGTGAGLDWGDDPRDAARKLANRINKRAAKCGELWEIQPENNQQVTIEMKPKHTSQVRP